MLVSGGEEGEGVREGALQTKALQAEALQAEAQAHEIQAPEAQVPGEETLAEHHGLLFCIQALCLHGVLLIGSKCTAGFQAAVLTTASLSSMDA